MTDEKKCACGLHWGHTGKHAPETAGIAKKECNYHADGKHSFLECDEWSRTCWCGATEKI